MELRANSIALTTGAKTRVQAFDGQAPYSYSVATGFDGSIDQGGIYKAPETTGRQIIEVTDNLGETAQIEIRVMSYLQLVCYIIMTEVNLDEDQVYIYNQKTKEPTDNRLYITVKSNFDRVFATSRKTDEQGNNVQRINLMENIGIDIFSRNELAKDLRHHVLMSLSGTLSHQIQEANGFRLQKIPTNFNDLSLVDGSVIPYRFNISLNMIYSVTRMTLTDYYESFKTEINTSTEKTKEFELNIGE